MAQTGAAEQLKELARAQTLTEEQLRTLLGWQVGEDGRRKGERYERALVRRAAVLLNGGAGGSTDEDAIRRRLTEALVPALGGELLRPDEDPFLAGLIWWKGDHVAVIEASLVVDEDDVNRALARAETLRRTGATVVPVVVGDVWDRLGTRVWAQAHRVEWKVGNELSDGLIAFRRLSG
ncbi:MAG: hypothetical protein HY332_21660 [Chloroflexi bacterium]|nr:hypothetical protein [Chloroflexota bacterium]